MRKILPICIMLLIFSCQPVEEHNGIEISNKEAIDSTMQLFIDGEHYPFIYTRLEDKSGSVIYDLAASQGGNSEMTKVNEIVDHNGVKIMGDSNILNKLPNSASNLYAKNMFNFVSNLYDKENKKFNINLEDEIIEKTQIK